MLPSILFGFAGKTCILCIYISISSVYRTYSSTVTDKLQQSGDMSVFAETKFFEKVTKEFEKIVKLAEFVFEDPRVLQHLKKMKIGDVPLEAILQHKGNVKTYL